MISSLELARLCGVSQGTVDRALHNRPGISARTRERVLAMAARHGYAPNPAARELLTGERRSIGAVIPAANSVFFMDLVNTIGTRLMAGGYRFLITPAAGPEEFLATLQGFAAMRVRGVVAVPPTAGMKLPATLASSLDVAALITPCEGKRVRAFLPDEVQTGTRATEYLISRGHRRILHLTYERQTPAIRDRARGYEKAMARHGLPHRVLRGAVTGGKVRQIREFGATAVFCHNDWQALSLIRALGEAGLRVPADISVMGVDDSPTFVALCPDITTLHYPSESIARAIEAWLAGKAIPPIAAVSLVERSSVRSLA